MCKRYLMIVFIAVGFLLHFSAHAKDWSFDVYLDKSKMGQHTFTLNNQQLTSKANFNVKVLFINAYRYEHQAVEEWSENCLTKITAHTVENKIITDVKGEKQEDNFAVSDGKTSQTLPACSMTFAYWNPNILTQKQLLNPQNAEWLDVKVVKLADEILQVKGQKTNTQHYNLKASLAGKNKLNIDLWYDEQKNWVALKSITPEGYVVSYTLK